jgi:hypothetical protein
MSALTEDSIDPKAQADEVLTRVTGMLDQAIGGLVYQAGNSATVVHDGYPFTLVGRRTQAQEPAPADAKNTSPIRWLGTSLLVQDHNDGIWSGESSNSALVVPGEFTTYRVDGVRFRDGVAIKQNMRSPGRGGFLMFEFQVTATLDATEGVQIVISPQVEMLNFTELPLSIYPEIRIRYYNADTADWTISRSAGKIYQLCAQYNPAGRVTIYQRMPRVNFELGSGHGDFNAPFFNVVG